MYLLMTYTSASYCIPYAHLCSSTPYVPVVVALARGLELDIILLMLVVLGKGTNDSVCVALAVPLVLYVALTGWLPSAITKCPSALSNDASDARGW